VGKAINYQSAGTVGIYFDALIVINFISRSTHACKLNMRNRRQSMALDLVEWMVIWQQGIAVLDNFNGKPQGHSIQVRLYAEDPAKNFL
jgi:urea carboxylase